MQIEGNQFPSTCHVYKWLIEDFPKGGTDPGGGVPRSHDVMAWKISMLKQKNLDT